MKRNKFLKGKILIDGDIVLKSSMLIGCGEDVDTDIDVIKDNEGAPFIPATSFVGVLKQKCGEIYGINVKNNDGEKFITKKEFEYIFGGNDNDSLLSCSDLIILTNKNVVETRDGVKINVKTGIAEDKGKYDYEVVAADSKFKLKIEIDLFSDLENIIPINKIKEVGGTIFNLLKEKGIRIGAKTNSGFGKAILETGRIFLLDFSRKEDVEAWLTGAGIKERQDESVSFSRHNINLDENRFIINVSLDIKNSLIIRSYSDNPEDPDASQLRSGDKYIISGTSIKGALRARAEHIMKTIADKNGISEEKMNAYINILFGNSYEIELNDETGHKKIKIDIPSRVLVEEVNLEHICSEVQSRIKIDRFTGGVINSALFDSLPVFPINTSGKESNIKNFTIIVKNALDIDEGLMLLLLKDIWTGNLAVGGEKNIGRGVFKGKWASIKNINNKEINFFKIDDISIDDKKYMEDLVKKLNEISEEELKKFESKVNKYKSNN